MTVDLTLYLLKPSVTHLDQVIPDGKRGLDGFEQVPVRDGFAEEDEYACWVKRNEPKPPDWTNWLEDGFDFGKKAPLVQSSGCVVLVRATGRFFAVCFGTGYHAIPQDLIDPDFVKFSAIF